MDGELWVAKLLWLDETRHEVAFRRPADCVNTVVALGDLRLITLTAVQPTALIDAACYRQPGADHPVPQVYRLSFRDGRPRLGVTLGYAEHACGHFLRRPAGPDGGVVRLLVPRSSGVALSFHDDRRHVERRATLGEAAEPAWLGPVRSDSELHQALHAQASMPLRLTGEVLVEMGLVTPAELAKVLVGQSEDPSVPVGERLVAAGCLSADDLRCALRRKRGIPLVDLRCLALEPALLKCLPLALARQWQVLPVMRADRGVVVAMADPDEQRVLAELRFLFQAPVVPVLPWGEVMDLMVDAAYARHRLDGC
jgi:hypothetical protein